MYHFELINHTAKINQLLLLADPDQRILDTYINRCYFFAIKKDLQIIGISAFLFTKPMTIEIANIAIDDNYQGLGLGKLLIKETIKYIKAHFKDNVSFLEIATGNSSIMQLALYQKCGFKFHYIDKDYFTKYYMDEIYENGIRCVDKIYLQMVLSEYHD